MLVVRRGEQTYVCDCFHDFLHILFVVWDVHVKVSRIGCMCQEIGLVAFMFFFELLFSYVSLSISFYVPLTKLILNHSFSLSANHPRHSGQRRSKISILLIQETV